MHKKSDKNIRKLTRIGKRSIAVVLPAEVLRDLHWREKQRVIVKRKSKDIVISDWPLRELRNKRKP